MFQGKKALITGASAGIGEEFARQLHHLGADLLLVARREDRLQALADEFNVLRSGSAEYEVVDLSVHEQVRSLAEGIAANRIDILVNNAGFGSFGRFEDLDIDRELAMMRVNAEAPLVLSHAAIAQMKERREGTIINISSIAGLQPLPYMATYAATKAVNFSHSLALRNELRSFGITVVAICPGPVATEFGGVARVPGTFTGGDRDGPDKVVRQALQAVASGKTYVVPCLKAKLLSLPVRILPITLTTWVTEKVLAKVLPWAHKDRAESSTS